MIKINLVRSDIVYKNVVNLPLQEQDDYFRENLLKPFKDKFEQQRIPFMSKNGYGFDALMLLSFANITPRKLNDDNMKLIEYMDDAFWNDCNEYLKKAFLTMKNAGIETKMKEYNFTVLLGDSNHPAMYLNNNYQGDGGVPGYIFISIVPDEYTMKRVKSVIAHEVNHNIRYQYINWDGGSIGELMIAEGLAENFVEKIYGSEYLGPWVTKIDWKRDNKNIKDKIYNNLNIDTLNKAMPYIYGDALTEFQGVKGVGLPHCAGYTCGYYLVRYFLEKTNISIEKASILPAMDILKEVPEFWKKDTL